MSDVTPNSGSSAKVADVGAALRQAREEKGISVRAAAMQTNLRQEIIEHLEANEFSAIGAPVFTRGYLNIYARFLGLDDGFIAQSFSATRPNKPDHDLRLNSANVESQNKPYRRSMARGWFSLLVVLLIGGAVISQLLDEQSWLMRQILGTFSAQTDTSGEPSDVASTADTTAVENVPEPPPLTVEVATEASPQNETLSLTSTDDLNGNNDDVLIGEPDLSLSSLELTDSAEGQSASDAPQVENTDASGIVLQTSQENWIQVTDSKGKVVYAKLAPPGEEVTLSVQDAPYQLNLGRPDAITLTVNGEERDISQYVRKGHARQFDLSIAND